MSDYTKAIIDVHNQQPETIESLLQRVKELEKELAALKAGQGEPVAWMWQHEETGKIGFTEVVQVTSGAHASLNPRLQLIAPLYTSAPTIPEGWQLVPVEPTEEMVSAGIVDEIGWGATISIYKDMLAAAPKPEEK